MMPVSTRGGLLRVAGFLCACAPVRQKATSPITTRKETAPAAEDGRLIAAKLRLGALAHISAAHLREHFEQATSGTSLQGLRLHIEEQPDIHHPEAQDIILDSLEFEYPDEY